MCWGMALILDLQNYFSIHCLVFFLTEMNAFRNNSTFFITIHEIDEIPFSSLLLRNQNMYIQTLQQRFPSMNNSPIPSLHPNFQFAKQKHVGGGGIIMETKYIRNQITEKKPKFVRKKDVKGPLVIKKDKEYNDSPKCNTVYLDLCTK